MLILFAVFIDVRIIAQQFILFISVDFHYLIKIKRLTEKQKMRYLCCKKCYRQS